MNLYFFESDKKRSDPINSIIPYQDQIHILIKRENVLTLLSNIIKDYQELLSNGEPDELLDIGLAGELTNADD